MHDPLLPNDDVPCPTEIGFLDSVVRKKLASTWVKFPHTTAIVKTLGIQVNSGPELESILRVELATTDPYDFIEFLFSPTSYAEVSSAWPQC